MNAAHVRELKTTISVQAKVDRVKVESHHKMQDQAKRADNVLSKDTVTAQKKLKKHSEESEAIVGDASQNISQLKHEVSFLKEDRDHERLSGEYAVLQERATGNKILLLDRKF